MRGQAVAETVFFLPLALLTLFGVIWLAQYGVMSERVQSAVRYGGLVSNQIDPYEEFSYYALYNSLGAVSSNSPLPVSTCVAPNTGSMQAAGSNATTGSPFPGQTSGPFWEATAAPATTTCLTVNSQKATFNLAGMNQTTIVLSNTPVVQTQMLVPAYMAQALKYGRVISENSLPANGTLNFMKPADLATLMTCHPGLQNTIGVSLSPPVPAVVPTTIPSALLEPVPTQTVPPNNC